MSLFQRGFYCGDLSLRYPYHEGTISIRMLVVCMLLLPMLFIIVIEIVRICQQFRMRQYLWNLWRSLATFSFGFIATYLTTELGKNVVGRLRPHFYAACQPRLYDGSTCDDPQNRYTYIEQYQCSNRNLLQRQLRELYVSFPSAHSSISFYSMLFLIFYVHKVWRRNRGIAGALRHLLQYALLMIAWYFALSRIVDRWHHWSDVLAGIVIGVIYATVSAFYIANMFESKKQKPHKQQQQQLHKRTHCSNNNNNNSNNNNNNGLIANSGGSVGRNIGATTPTAKDSLIHYESEWRLHEVIAT